MIIMIIKIDDNSMIIMIIKIDDNSDNDNQY